MTTKQQSTKKGAKKGGVGSKRKARRAKTVQVGTKAEAFKQAAVAYAQRAYNVALRNFEATEGKPHRFSRSLLVIDYDRDDPESVSLAVRVPDSFKDNCQLDAADFLGWREDAEYIARVLEHRECPTALKEAVGAICSTSFRA